MADSRCILLFGLLVSFYTVEKFGRRTLILTGGVTLAIVNIVIACLGFPDKTDTVLNLTLAFICIWVFLYATMFAGTAWTLAGEIASPRLRSKTTTFSTNTYSIHGLVFSTTVPFMLATSGPGARNWGQKSLFLFAILSAIGTVVNYFIVPEVGWTRRECR